MFKPLPYWGVWLLVNLAMFTVGATHSAPAQIGFVLSAVCVALAFNLVYLICCLWFRRRGQNSGPA